MAVGPVTPQTRRVLVAPATTRTEVVPATYKTETVREILTPATTRTEVIPATYKTEVRQVPVAGTDSDAETEFETVTEQVLVTPATTRTVTVPAVYETVTERVLVKESYTEWKEASKVYALGEEALGGIIRANRVSDTKIMCLVEVPAEFETVTKRVVVSEATTREEVVPAVYETVTKRVPVDGGAADPAPQAFKEVEVRVIDTPEEVRVIPVPAVYQSVTRRVIDTPAVTRTIPVPAVYREEPIEAPAPKEEWVSVLCDVNATPDLVMSLQRSLRVRELYDGPIDGIIGPLTRRAIRSFQDGKSDVLSMASARKLGLAI